MSWRHRDWSTARVDAVVADTGRSMGTSNGGRQSVACDGGRGGDHRVSVILPCSGIQGHAHHATSQRINATV